MEGVGAFVDTVVASLEANKDWVQMAFSGVGVVMLAAVLRWVFRKRRSSESQAQQKPDLSQRNRQRMLDKVRHMWVEGVLEQSLYQAARIELGISEAPEAIEHPWKLVSQQPERAPQMLRDGIPMVEVFEQYSETLLILGAPGSGKTTLLLELARGLIERAKKDAAYPIPVVFNLSSWALERKALEKWLVDELNQRYDAPRKVAHAWVENDEILPLIDGLDEVDKKHRDRCAEAINTFRTEHGLLPLVVCSRSVEYEKLSVQLRLPGAVKIQPLTRAQVERYLERAGTALSGVCAAVGQDDTLWELLDTPLMLSIIALAYQGQMASVAKIARLKGGLEERRVALFDAYIEAMFKRRSAASPYTPAQTRHWMRWLAEAMVGRDQTVFYLERLQPDWLPKKRVWIQTVGSWLGTGLGTGLVVGLMAGLLFTVLITAVAYYEEDLEGMVVWFVVLFSSLSLLAMLLFGLFGFTLEVFFSLYERYVSKAKTTIRPTEAIRWSWRKARGGLERGIERGPAWGAKFFLVLFCLALLTGGLRGAGVSEAFLIALIMLLVGGVFGMLIGGLAGTLLGGFTVNELPTRTVPNEGIRRSLRNALLSGGFCFLVFSLPLTLLFTQLSSLAELTGPKVHFFDFAFAAVFGFPSGLICGLLNGGRAWIQHRVLRLILWRYQYAPLRYVRLLDHAANLLFLRKVGGGYIFVHRMLMEHFARLGEAADGEPYS